MKVSFIKKLFMENLCMKKVYRFLNEHVPSVAGMGVVEVILITVVLIGLVIIFQSNIKNIVSSIFATMQTNVGKIH